jgi:2,3-bisphosphoglycerate-dependent phosphoglycerate mutase
MSKQHLPLEESDSLGIWFVRHAESEANVHRIYANTGASFPLTVNGVQQARTLAKRLSSVQIRAIYTSPLLRATQTAEELCKTRKMKMQVAPELIEYSVGIYEGTSTLPDTAGAIADGEIKTRWFEYDDFDACLPGGESLNDMRRRFLPLVKRTIEDASESGIVLLITHGGILEAMLPFVFENIDFNFTRTHPIGNITIVKGKLQDGQLVCLEYNGKIMLQSNHSG